jgi:hypothetical protein
MSVNNSKYAGKFDNFFFAEWLNEKMESSGNNLFWNAISEFVFGAEKITINIRLDNNFWIWILDRPNAKMESSLTFMIWRGQTMH